MLKKYDELFFLPFDHRTSFEKDLFGIINRSPSLKEVEEIMFYKNIIFEGFTMAIQKGVPIEKSGILVDEQFGSQILKDAKSFGCWTACCAEKSGQKEFEFEYGINFKEHILKVNPDFVKALIRYNPEADRDLNRRQTDHLRILSQFCEKNNFNFMLELLVPATFKQVSQVDGDIKRYDSELRPKLMVASIKALQEKGIEPIIWKVEGVDNPGDCFSIVEQAQINSRDEVKIIVLGRGENLATIKKWLSVASKVDGYIGFAVGRTVWEDALKSLKDNKISKDEAIDLIAKNFKTFSDLWMDNQPTY